MGVAMAVVALVLERIVLRSVRRKAERSETDDGVTLTGRGTEVTG